jgi:aminoglycoside/choline kinase family phosphotransferase
MAEGAPENDRARSRARTAFLAGAGWGEAAIEALPADASFRRYFRLSRAGDSRLLMDAPPAHENVRPYLRVAEHLLALGLSAPRVDHRDLAEGFLLIEDFGDDTFTRLLAAGAEERPLYEAAVEVLIALHQAPGAAAIELPRYDAGPLLEEAALLTDWYLPAKRGRPCPAATRVAYLEAWRAVFDALPPAQTSLVLRDFHVDNLMRLAGREGAAACGLLDFQDALIGPCAYDLMSLLEDARRDIAPSLAEAMLARYFAAFPALDRDGFMAWYGVLAAQRHAKVAGIFVRLKQRDGKAVYLQHIPRVVRLLAGHLEEPPLAALRHWMDRHLPDLLQPLPPPET